MLSVLSSFLRDAPQADKSLDEVGGDGDDGSLDRDVVCRPSRLILPGRQLSVSPGFAASSSTSLLEHGCLTQLMPGDR